MDEIHAIGDLKVLRATWALFVSADRFAAENEAHLERGRKKMNLMLTLPALGKLPHQNTPAGERLASDQARSALLKWFQISLFISTVVLLVALSVAYFFGVIHSSLPWSASKVLQAGGGTLALWGTLLGLSGPPRTWGGNSVAERVHSFVFTSILCTGGTLALLASLL